MAGPVGITDGITIYNTGIGEDERLFATSAAKVRKKWKESYGGTKPHDIRHVVATEAASKALESLIPPMPKTERQKKTIIGSASDAASKKLGNNRSEAFKTYIDSSIWDRIKVGG